MESVIRGICLIGVSILNSICHMGKLGKHILVKSIVINEFL